MIEDYGIANTERNCKNLQDTEFYSVMGDEANDISNVSQLVICMR